MAVELVRRGKSTVIIDLDPQGSVLKWAARREADQPRVVASEMAQLATTLAAFKAEGIDFVVLDLPGSRAPSVNEGIRSADFVVIPARPGDMDIEASATTLATTIRLKKPYAFAMSIAPARGARTKAFAEDLEAHGQPVLPVFVIERLAYMDAIAEGLGITEFETKGRAATEEIAAFTSAVLERIK